MTRDRSTTAARPLHLTVEQVDLLSEAVADAIDTQKDYIERAEELLWDADEVAWAERRVESLRALLVAVHDTDLPAGRR